MKFLKKAGRLVSGFLEAMRDDHVGAYAAQTAYFIMLSFFPFIILLVTLIRYTSITPADVYEAAQMIFPPSMDSFILGLINEVYSKTAVTVSISAVVAAWSAGKGFLGLMRGMNTIYNVEERRNYIILRLRSALYAIIFVIAIILSLVVLVFGNSIHAAAVEHLPFLAVVTGMVVRLKGIVGVCFLTAVFMIFSRFVPPGPSVQSGAGRIIFRRLLVSVFHRVLVLCGTLSRTGQHVRKPYNDCSGNAVALFLYVYYSAGSGNQFLF